MIVVGLTGGIATGKSTVSRIFNELGAEIIDADLIAHQVVQKGLPAWQGIVDHFGEKILGADGEIDRVALGDIIFNDTDQKKILNSIVHPHVFEEIASQMKRIETTTPHSIIILDVPLLIESGMHKTFSDFIVVYVSKSIQLERLMQRDRISEAAARARIASQMPIEAKRAMTQLVIDNSRTMEATRQATSAIYRQLKAQL